MPPLLPTAPPPTPMGGGTAYTSSVFGSPSRDLVATGILSLVAGFVDAAGFLALFGLFTAHVTGDLVAAGTSLTSGGNGATTLRLATIPVFMISVAATTLVARATRLRGHRPLITILALMTVALTVFCATGVALRSRLEGLDEWAVVLTGAVGVFAMGIQNTLMRDVLSGLGPTTLMTGNLTRLTMDLVELVLPEGDISPGTEGERRRIEARLRLSKSATPVCTFMLGTALGGAATAIFGLWSIALPATTIGALTVSTWLRSKARDALPRRAFGIGLDHKTVMVDAFR